MDRQGRVLIPPLLREFAGLESQVVVVGTGEGMEIWNAADFEAAISAEEGAYRESLEGDSGA
jgi:MraZ protein